MKKWTKSVLVTVLSAVFLLGCVGTAWAAPADRDANSYFAKATGTSDDGISQFYLIKDYDSVHNTKNNSNSTQGAPFSSSPAETFTYTITPYGVWNAGSTYSSTGTGTATPITKANMPMLTGTDDTSVTFTPSGEKEARKLVIDQVIASDAALKEDSDDNAHDKKTLISLPTYDTVGDYWYKVQETIGANGKRTTGVIYGTNDGATANPENKNGDHTATYYFHVQVTKNGSAMVKNVTLHTNAPDTGWTNTQYNAAKDTMYGGGNKVNAIENRYYAGQLKVHKDVSGSAGDTTQYFKVRVTFIKPEGTVLNSDIAIADAYMRTETTSGSETVYSYSIPDTAPTIRGQYYSEAADASNIKWDKHASDDTEAKAVVEFYVKNGSTVTFSNIPCGVNYTVEEYTTDDLGYSNTFTVTPGSDDTTYKFNGNNGNSGDYAILKTDSANSGSHFYTNDTPAVGAQGSITGAAADIVTITNSKVMTIDIGVITENAPFIALIAVSGAVLFLLVSRKKKLSEV